MKVYAAPPMSNVYDIPLLSTFDICQKAIVTTGSAIQ